MTGKKKLITNGIALRFYAARAVFFIAVVLGGLNIAHAAMPKDDWLVGPIYASSSSGKSFCSMKNTYDNGYSIVFARDVAGANSIALTFDKKALSAGSQYYATFTVGPLSRMMVSIAATTQILITQMGDDPDFYELLALKDKLYVEINNDRLAFDLKGTAQALEQLAICADSVGLGESFTAVNVAAVAAGADDFPLPKAPPKSRPMAEFAADALARNKDMKLSQQSISNSSLIEVERLRHEKERLERENQAISEKLHTSDLEAAQIEAARAAEFERKERALMIENEYLRERLATAQAGKAIPARPKPAVPPVAQQQMPVPADAQPAAAAYVPPGPAQASLADWARRAAGAPVAVEMPPVETGIRAWRWQAGEIYVALQELPYQDSMPLQQAAEQYIATVRSRCTGDFARKLASVRSINADAQGMTAELACMNDTQDAAAGLAFIARGDRMIVLTYESSTENMFDMLAMRDLFISKAYGGKLTL